MILHKVAKDELKAAAKIAQLFRLVQIRPQRLVFENLTPRAGEAKNAKLRAEFELRPGTQLLRDGFFDVVIHAYVGFLEEQEASKNVDQDNLPTTDIKRVATIDSEFLITFRTPEGPVPENIRNFDIPAFAKTTALTIAWPYIRHHIDHLASSASIPFIMPILCIDAEDDHESTTSMASTDR